MSVKNSGDGSRIESETTETVTVTVRVTTKESGRLLELVTEKLIGTPCVNGVSVDSVKRIDPKNGHTNVTAAVTLTHQATGEGSNGLIGTLENRVCVDAS